MIDRKIQSALNELAQRVFAPPAAGKETFSRTNWKGHLQEHHDREGAMSTEQDTRSREMLATALTMEQKGMAFYEKAASDCSNEFGREMCLLLKDYENIHIERIKTIYDSLKGSAGWSDEWAGMKPGQDLGAVFRALAEKHAKTVKSNAGDLEILDLGLDFEQKSIDFYSKRLSEAEAVLEREFLDQMIMEEREHFRILSDMRQYYSDPAAWMMEKERVSLDGA